MKWCCCSVDTVLVLIIQFPARTISNFTTWRYKSNIPWGLLKCGFITVFAYLSKTFHGFPLSHNLHFTIYSHPAFWRSVTHRFQNVSVNTLRVIICSYKWHPAVFLDISWRTPSEHIQRFIVNILIFTSHCVFPSERAIIRFNVFIYLLFTFLYLFTFIFMFLYLYKAWDRNI